MHKKLCIEEKYFETNHKTDKNYNWAGTLTKKIVSSLFNYTYLFLLDFIQ